MHTRRVSDDATQHSATHMPFVGLESRSLFVGAFVRRCDRAKAAAAAAEDEPRDQQREEEIDLGPVVDARVARVLARAPSLRACLEEPYHAHDQPDEEEAAKAAEQAAKDEKIREEQRGREQKVLRDAERGCGSLKLSERP